MKDLNLIPKSYLLEKQKKVKRIRTLIIAIISSMIIAVCIIIPLFMKYNLQKQVDSVKNDIERTSGYKLTQERLDKIKESYGQREKIANSFAIYGISAVTLLEKIEKGVPEKLFITDLNIGSESADKVQITMTGVCATEDDVASFVTHLREDNYYSDIFISSVKKNTVVPNTSAMTAIIGNTINSNTAAVNKPDVKTTSSKPTPGISLKNKKTVTSKPVDKVQSTPATITCFNFNISLNLKIKK